MQPPLARKDTWETRIVRVLVWVYFILLIVEGALRKWILPGWSNVLLLVRDPVALLLCFVSLRTFPWRSKLVLASLVICIACIFTSSFNDKFDPLITLYGARANFLHLLLIFLIPIYLHRGDVVILGKWIMILSIPVVFVMVKQFEGGMNSPWNVGAGGSMAGQLATNVGNKARASGPFSFISGPVLFFPLVAGFVFNAVAYRGQAPVLLAIAAGGALLLAIPVSVSRSLLLAVVVIGVGFCVATLVTPRLFGKGVKVGILVGVLFLTVGGSTLFRDASGVLSERWEAASMEGEGFYVNVVERLLDGIRIPFSYWADVPLFGVGLGNGTNAASYRMTGQLTFLLSEGEWGRILMESGFFLGLLFIGIRLLSVVSIFVRSWQCLRRGDLLPILLWSACALNILNGQWGQPTTLGFAALGGGLTLAACRPVPRGPRPVPRRSKRPADAESTDAGYEESERPASFATRRQAAANPSMETSPL